MSDRGVSNYFEILGESPRPWLDEDKLKSRFLELSAPLHPDKMVSASDAQKDEAGSRFAAINQAYQVLRSPKDRLHHLLDLTSLKLNDVQKIPPGTMDLFMEIGQVCRDTDAFLELKNKETSPLMKATLFIKGQGWSEKLEVLQQKVSEKRISLESTLKALDSEWPEDNKPNPTQIETLENTYRALSYVSRWSEQIEERFVSLMI